MVTLILLVVLSGAGGLLVLVLLGEDGTRPPTTRQGDAPSLRAPSGPDTAPLPAVPPSAAPSAGAIPVVATDQGRKLLLRPPATGPDYGDPTGIPAGFRAVEGSYGEVGRSPWWRRLLSLGAIAGIVVVVAIVFAGVLGALIGAAAELVDGAIG